MQQNRPALLRLAQRRCASREDAEDAVQDAYLSAFRHLDQFDGRAQLSSWLTRIVLNAAIDQRRRARPTVPLAGDNDPEARAAGLPLLFDPAPDPEEQCARGERHAALHRLTANLPQPWRRTLKLRAIDGLSTRETAQTLGVAEGTVKTHLFRAHRQLQRQALPLRRGFCGR